MTKARTPCWSCRCAKVSPQVVSRIVKLLIWWLLMEPLGVRSGSTPRLATVVPKSHREGSPSPAAPFLKALPPSICASRRFSACRCTSSANLPESCGPARNGCARRPFADGRRTGSWAKKSFVGLRVSHRAEEALQFESP